MIAQEKQDFIRQKAIANQSDLEGRLVYLPSEEKWHDDWGTRK